MKVRQLGVSLLTVVLLVTFINPAVILAAPPAPLDLHTDLDRDGVPDALTLAVEQLATARNSEVAIQDLLARVPYQAETYMLQKEAALLNQQLEFVRSPEEAERIHAQLQEIAAKMAQDPAYIDFVNGLERLYVQQGLMVEENTERGRDFAIQAVNWGNLQAGDVMLVRSGKFPWTSFLYAMTYSHTGNYNGNSQVYESNADGVRLKPLSNWQVSGQYIALGRSNKRTVAQVQAALAWAKGRYGTNGSTPYNYFYPNKTTDNSLYCSQLTWKIHNYTGVNVDSNAWQYQLWIAAKWGVWAVAAVAIPAVAPDEVGLDGDITYYSKAWN